MRFSERSKYGHYLSYTHGTLYPLNIYSFVICASLTSSLGEIPHEFSHLCESSIGKQRTRNHPVGWGVLCAVHHSRVRRGLGSRGHRADGRPCCSGTLLLLLMQCHLPALLQAGLQGHFPLFDRKSSDFPHTPYFSSTNFTSQLFST